MRRKIRDSQSEGENFEIYLKIFYYFMLLIFVSNKAC